MTTPLIITQWWSELGTVQQVFWGIALVFTILFTIQFVLSLIGLDMDTDVDGDIDTLDGDIDMSYDFKIFSIRSIIAFFAFFGWVGLFVYNRSGQVWLATALAALAGFIAMVTIAYLMYLMTKLEYEGTISLKDSLHNTGEVYLRVPENQMGTGKIHVNIHGAMKEVDAMTQGSAIPTGSKIKIVDIINRNTVLVESTNEI